MSDISLWNCSLCGFRNEENASSCLCYVVLPLVHAQPYAHSCRDEERKALLNFKRSVDDEHHHLLSDRDGSNCCGWDGVGCSNKTGHVLKLNITEVLETRWQYIIAPIFINDLFHSLSTLKYLHHLDLSYFTFKSTTILKSIGSLTLSALPNQSPTLFW